MDFMKFAHERNRMCDTHRSMDRICEGCPLDKEVSITCSVWCLRNPEEAVAAVEQWAKEHPIRTRQSEFLKLYPNSKLSCDTIDVCPQKLDQNYNPSTGCPYTNCADCRREFWLAEVEA